MSSKNRTMRDIERFNPCREALEYRRKFKTFREAWENCQRGDWMLWIAVKYRVSLRKIILAKGHCANTVRHLMLDGRSKKAADMSIKFGEGKATRKQLNAAYAAASYADASADPDVAAAYAARAAAAASDAAYDADAAYAAADAASYASYAYAANKDQTADICRKYLTRSIMIMYKKSHVKQEQKQG